MKGFEKILIAICLLFAFNANAQYCTKFERKFCPPSDNPYFKYNSQSRGALFAKGKTSSLNLVVYKGQDYRITLCCDEALGNRIEFKIFEKKKVKVEKEIKRKETEDILDEYGEPTGETKEVVYTEKVSSYEYQKQMLYDNAAAEYGKSVEFTIDQSRRLILEVTIPNDGMPSKGSAKGVKDKGKGKSMQSSEMGCLGVLVEHMTTPKSGF